MNLSLFCSNNNNKNDSNLNYNADNKLRILRFAKNYI